MAKTYTALTAANATAGNAILASDFSSLFTNSNNYRVPPMCRVYRSSDWTYSGTYISWNAEQYDTDGMWSSGTDVTIQTDGIYLVEGSYAYTCTASNTWMALIIAKGTVFAARTSAPAYGTTLGFVTCSAVLSCVSGDIIRLLHDPFGGSSFVAKGGTIDAANGVTHMSVTWLGQAS
jgi:hypothetical protein